MTTSPYQPFSLAVIPHRERVTLVPIGELDILTAHELEREAGDLATAGFRRLVVDLRKTEFLDSSGLRVLLALREDARSNGHAVSLVQGSDAVQRIFRVTGTDGLFEWETERPYRP
jgi:anti-sigma B factor antagonist